MGVSKIWGIPKWMVKIGENPIKMDDLGVPLFSETSIYIYIHTSPKFHDIAPEIHDGWKPILSFFGIVLGEEQMRNR